MVHLLPNLHMYLHQTLMNTDTADAILAHHNSLRSWRQPFMFTTPHGLVGLSVLIGDKATTQKNASQYQTADYPNWSRSLPIYRFDPASYCDQADEKKLIYYVKQSLVGVNFFQTILVALIYIVTSISSAIFQRHSVK